MRAMQTAGVGGDAAVRVDSGGSARAAKSDLGERSHIDRGVSAVVGNAGKHRVGGTIFRVEEFWRGRADGAGGERGGCYVDPGERVARGEQ